MDPKQELSVIFGTSTQSVVDQIVQDASTPAFGLNGRVPCRTVAYKGYSQNVTKQRGYQKNPQKRTSQGIIEK